MAIKKISAGVVHELPDDLRAALAADTAALDLWEGLTLLSRNEWICWVLDAKKTEIREARIERVRSDLCAGKRRPCCWPGCPHRIKDGGTPG